ncbi:MAG TPA: YraN family protein [Candidatus Paceibacterota bacterium]|jgi:putative endonuclease|nr:YraN family protein [Candidatus Paceibacterota bacterium]
MAKTAKRQIGDTGEDVACKYLQNKGFSVIERNYLRKWGEIDVIAQKANRLYFVEVKTVTRATGGIEGQPVGRPGTPVTYRPEDNVHPAKLMRLHRAIQTYLLDHKVPESMEWQVDVACVYLDFSTRKAHVEILENVIL